MSVKAFKFASPGIFLNEIDQSQTQQPPAPVGPIIIGRAQRGPAMRPVTVASYDEFVQTFGEPVAGGDSSGDVWRSGVPAGPTYGPYAAQAWFANNPTVTYLRLLGVQSETATGTTNNSGQAGWTYGGTANTSSTAGAYGLYVFPDISATAATSSLTSVETGSIKIDTAVNNNILKITFPAGFGSSTQVDYTIKISSSITSPAANTMLVASALADSVKAQVIKQVITDGVSAGIAANVSTGSGFGNISNLISASYSGTDISLYSKILGTLGNNIQVSSSGTTLKKVTGIVNFVSGSESVSSPITGTLAAVWYCSGSVPVLSGTLVGSAVQASSNASFIKSDSSGKFTVKMSNDGVLVAGVGGTSKKTFSFSPSDGQFIRKSFNTNPQNCNTDSVTGLDTNGSSYYGYWLGETFENDITSNTSITSLTSQMAGIILPLNSLNTRLGFEAEENYVARTGWIVGNADLGTNPNYSVTTAPKLFRFVATDGGDWIRNNLKITINNITPPQNDAQKFATFDVEIRRINDTDANKKLVESYTGCDLDDGSPNYIARKIGDVIYSWDDTERKVYVKDGKYPNNSKFVRVEMYSDFDNTRIPFGVLGPLKYKDLNAGSFVSASSGQGIISEFNNAYGSPSLTPFSTSCKFIFPSLRQRVSSSEDSLTTYKLADWGAATTRGASSILYNEGVNDLLRVPAIGVSEFVNGVASTNLQHAWTFSLDEIVQTGSGAATAYYYLSGSKASGTSFTATSSSVQLLTNGVNSFTTVFQGGTDGFNILEGEPLRNTAMAGSPTNDNNYIYYTYRRAIDTVRDPEEVQGNALVIPGLVQEQLTAYELQIAEQRGDVIAVIDASGDTSAQASYVTKYEVSDNVQGTTNDRVSTVDQVVAQIKSRNLNSSYGATYYPWVQIADSNSGKILAIPPSVVALGAMSYTDAVQAPWFAPAGFNRGGLSTGNAGVNVVNVLKKLSSADRDKLYPVNINPIASFPNEGIVIFGQKTLQATPSALDRINVRRLMLYIKRGINQISTSILFEPNVEATWNNFKDQAEPFLADVKARFGLTDYKLILDSTTTTPDLIDQNIMYAKIYLKPARAIEFIAIDFFITKTGAQFPA
jgi:hypothetical protein